MSKNKSKNNFPQEKHLHESLKNIGSDGSYLVNGAWIPNVERETELLSIFAAIPQMMDGENIKTSYSMHQTIPSRGAIAITGNRIRITNPKMFIKAMGKADRLDVDKCSDGSIGIEISFNALAMKVGD